MWLMSKALISLFFYFWSWFHNIWYQSFGFQGFTVPNRSSWTFRYNLFSTNFQKPKFLRCEAKILRNIITKFQSLVRNIFGDMICGSQVFLQASQFNLNSSFQHLRYNFFSTKVQKLKVLEREAAILRNIITKFWILVHNIFGDMICGSQGFLQAPEFNINRSSWNFHYKFFSTKVQNLKFIWCEAEILRKFVKKFQSLVCNICGDMICGRQCFFKLLNFISKR